MKKLLLIIAAVLLCGNTFAQEKTYLLFEFMKVDNEQEQAYWETDNFWEKIHQERVKNGDIIAWDLWSLKPGGEHQGYQYLTVCVYNDPVKMFNGGGDFGAALKGAYPEMSEDEIEERMTKTVQSRDLAVRMYLEIVNGTESDFKMEVGTIASIEFMKALDNNSWDYENAEIETFLPMHQKEVDSGSKGSWALIRVLSPTGTEAYASHLTVNMYTGFDQLLKSQEAMWGSKPAPEMMKKIEEGIKTRDLKMVSLATLIKRVK